MLDCLFAAVVRRGEQWKASYHDVSHECFCKWVRKWSSNERMENPQLSIIFPGLENKTYLTQSPLLLLPYRHPQLLPLCHKFFCLSAP